MAFNGGINEFGVVALLQLPGTNHLSGKLVLLRLEQEANFFYTKGKLTHAILNDFTGKDVLLEVIDWLDGEFSFDSNASTDQHSIKQDLQNTLMWALKERDELKKKRADEEQAAKEKQEQLEAEEKAIAKENARAEAQAEAKRQEQSKVLTPKPILLEESLFKDLSLIQNAYLLNSKGHIIANGSGEKNFDKDISSILTAIQKFTEHYPLETFGKSFIEDSSFTIALSKLENSLIIVIVVPSNTRLGMLSIELNKFVRLLQSSGLDILNAK